MDESVGAQYAIQIAVYTLKERCKSLQERIDVLEEENRNLHVSLSRNTEMENSLSEIDKLKQNITELTEQNNQLTNKCKMVMKENEDLWKKLTKLTHVNKNLDSNLHKISNSIAQHTNTPPSALIRSKTFTQIEPQTKILQKNLEENDKISLELEDISLKLADSLSKQKLEMNKLVLDVQVNENYLLNGNFSFSYDDDKDGEIIEEIEVISNEVRLFYDEIVQQKQVLQEQIKLLEQLNENKKNKVCTMDRSTFTGDELQKQVNKDELNTKKVKYETKGSDLSELEKICPMCSRNFSKGSDFETFQRHVENHFIDDTPSFEML